DYIGAGPVFATLSKPDAGEPLGLERLGEIAAAVGIPVVAIGGITLENVAQVFAAGACGAAVLSAVVSADDMGAAARALKRRIAGAIGPARPAGGDTGLAGSATGPGGVRR
ncbi:MAG: thiamine phosphate synthase, partial [Acidobacteria bacterium]|nr:thiamine phosphate synthase [Acidobacteriota bacterium]